MNSKECREVPAKLFATMATQKMQPSPMEMSISVQTLQMQAMWEIAAQLADINERLRGEDGPKPPDSKPPRKSVQ